MSIDRTSPLKPVSTVQQRETQEPQASRLRTDKTAEQSTSTNVTQSHSLVALTQQSASDINIDKVEALKTAIRNGDLKMDTGKIADALIQDARNLVDD